MFIGLGEDEPVPVPVMPEEEVIADGNGYVQDMQPDNIYMVNGAPVVMAAPDSGTGFPTWAIAAAVASGLFLMLKR